MPVNFSSIHMPTTLINVVMYGYWALFRVQDTETIPDNSWEREAIRKCCYIFVLQGTSTCLQPPPQLTQKPLCEHVN